MAYFPVEDRKIQARGESGTLLHGLQRKQFDRGFYQNLLRVPGGAVEVAQLLWAAKVKKRRAFSKRADVFLRIDCEQRPQAESRIRLAEERDRLGMPVCVVDWKVSEDEHETVKRYAQTIDGVLRSAASAT